MTRVSEKPSIWGPRRICTTHLFQLALGLLRTICLWSAQHAIISCQHALTHSPKGIVKS